MVPFTFDSVLTWATRWAQRSPDRYGPSPRPGGARPGRPLAQRLLLHAGVTELISFVCVRADHQWAATDAGHLLPKDGALAWCPDTSLGADEAHEWRTCDAAPLSAIAGLAAELGTVESAVS